MRQGIQTKWIGQTNHRPTRIKALSNRRSDDRRELSVTISYDYNGEAKAHAEAAKALALKMGWYGVWVAGGSPDHNGSLYVALEGVFSRQWCEQYLCGVEGEDWFRVEREL